MMFPFLTIFILFLAWFAFNRIRTQQKEAEMQKAFWQKEADANSTRRKDISSLPYLVIPLKELPFDADPADDVLTACEDKVRALSQEKILNLTGQTNTELKLAYGAPNLNLLSRYDQNFTELVRTMQRWGMRLHELSLDREAKEVLSLSVRWGSDIKGTYLLLAQIYRDTGQSHELARLREQANQLDSLMKQPILDALKSY